LNSAAAVLKPICGRTCASEACCYNFAAAMVYQATQQQGQAGTKAVPSQYTTRMYPNHHSILRLYGVLKAHDACKLPGQWFLMILHCECTVWLAIYTACPSCGSLITQICEPHVLVALLALAPFWQAVCKCNYIGLDVTASLQQAGAHAASLTGVSAPNTKGAERSATVYDLVQTPLLQQLLLLSCFGKINSTTANNNSSTTSRAAPGGTEQVVQMMYCCCCPMQRTNYTVCLHVPLQQQNSPMYTRQFS
jgi:hypothetical protein